MLWRLCANIGFTNRAIRLNCDSFYAMSLAKNRLFHALRKLNNIQFHFIRDMVDNGMVLIHKVDTLVNVVNSLTKLVSPNKFT